MEFLSKDTLFIIALNLNLKDLLSFCQTSKYIKNILYRDTLWLYKIKQSFPTLSMIVMNIYKNDRSLKEYYIQDLYKKIPPIPKYSFSVRKDPNILLTDSSKIGRLDLVIAAIDCGADIHSNEDAAFRLASVNGHYETVKFLVDSGANIHAYDDAAVRLASAKGHYAVVRYLIDRGANIYARDNEAIKNASLYGHRGLANYLAFISSKKR